MATVPETLNMDHGISFRKKNHITVSKNIAILILATFLACLVAVGLITHYLSVPTSETTDLPDHDHRTEPPKKDTKYLRLPRSVVPHDYDLRIITYMNNFTFHGWARIDFAVVEETRNVTLHVHHLTVFEDTVHVLDSKGNVRMVEKCAENKQLQFYVISLKKALKVGNYSVEMEYDGKLNDDLAGFYRSSYKVANDTKWIAATQFEATDARRAFPCFDEPALKATFKITIGRLENMNSISNMPRTISQNATDYPGYVWDEFERSVPMSTYLVAFIVSDFTSDSIGNFSLWARTAALNQTKVALELGPKFLDYYEQYFDVPFPLPKMDMAAIPDFPAGAMENWGLITYRENTLLYEEGISTKKDLAHIATVIAHELGHQWFGNLVTMKWWSDLWLNEGFASYVENLAADHVYPNWKVMDMFVVNYLHVVFHLDGLESSHPISVVVNNPDEINDIFDRISYLKGASIIRMMESFLTAKVFQKGLTKYLNDMKYKSAEQDDLWDCLTFQGRKDNVIDETMSIKEAMDPWTLQTGYPVVTVSRSSNKINFKQERFLLSTNKTDSDTLWGIPLSYTDKSGSNLGVKWMKQNEKQLEVTLNQPLRDSDWFLLNINQTGYYRVNYDQMGWKLIVAQLRSDHKIFDVKNRAQILDDAFSLASAGYLDYEVPLNVSMYLTEEEEFVPWRAAFSNLDYVKEMFLRSGYFDKYKIYMLTLMTKIYKNVGFKESKDDSLQRTYLRGEILRRACDLGYSDCINKAVADFRSWMLAADPDNDNPISANSKSLVYCTAVELLGAEAFNFVWQRYLKANVATEKDLLLSALGCTHEPWLIYKFMSLAITEDADIRKQDVGMVFSSLGRHIVGQTLGFRFVTTNWNRINEYMGKSITTTSGIIKAVTRNMNTEKELEELTYFTQKHSDDGTITQRSIDQMIEQTKANIDWTKNHFKPILNWIQRQNIQL